ncbi:MAG TPA: VOC family protein [Phenylobacterium sp.]
MIDHLGITVVDVAASRAFYVQALEPLGVKVMMEFDTPGGPVIGMGTPDRPFFWLSRGAAPQHTHLALQAQNRAAVDAFYAAAMAAGAKDNGGPGLRPDYHPNYYGAFVIDLNGINLEAVCHTPE